MPGTAISSLYEYVRALLGDFDATIRKYEDGAILSVVKTVVIMGELPGYTLSGTDIVPELATPKDYAIVLTKAALKFVAPNAASYAYGTRALRESFGEQREFLFELHQMIANAEFPDQMTSFVDFATWMTGMTGVDVWTHLTQMTVDAPVATANISLGGLTVN